MKVLVLLLLSFCAYANLDKAPPSFKINKLNAVYMDISNAHSHLYFDMEKREIIATTTLEFTTRELGQPLFDLVPEIISAELDGVAVNIKEISSPENTTEMRMIDKAVEAGSHKLIIKNEITTNARINSNSIDIAFWMSDLTDRRYLERYIPANFEFDQYALELELSFSKITVDRHDIFTNGMLSEVSPNHYKINFPEYFTASSYYFHMVKKDRFPAIRTHFMSIDGRKIPMTIYSGSSWSLSSAERNARKVLAELESILGAWGHPSLTIYIAGSGGMEYSGATITSMSALGHELTHSYFARGVMPVRGNSGWIDEAIASWRDDGYRTRSTPGFRTTSMGAHSVYRRHTDRKAYDQGADFMEYLNHKLSAQGGLKAFLKDVYSHKLHHTITTKNLQNMLESYSGIDFSGDFKQYILGGSKNKQIDLTPVKENPFHKALTEKEELELL